MKSLVTLINIKVIWVKFHPGTPLLTLLGDSNPVDLPLDLGKYRGKFGDDSYYGD